MSPAVKLLFGEDVWRGMENWFSRYPQLCQRFLSWCEEKGWKAGRTIEPTTMSLNDLLKLLDELGK